MRSDTALGLFVLEAARGNEKKHVFTADRAQTVREQLSETINGKVEEIRSKQRRALEESATVTIF